MREFENRHLFESFRERYHRGSKKGKGAILDEVCERLGWHRKHAIRQLSRKNPGRPKKAKKRGRRSKYEDPSFLKALKKLWFMTDQMCSKLLKEAIPNWLPYYEKHYGEVSGEVREKLLGISPATMDRVLASTKVAFGKGRSGTKPGNMLREQIPISTDCWDTTIPGYFEADTVAHCGGRLEGDFINSLTMVDIATTWTEVRAIWNKGQHATLEQIEDVENCLPFPILGFDSDNGGEFINYHLQRYFTDAKTKKLRIAFTRSRAYKKNDNAHVEQRNWSHARQLLGYQRLEFEQLVPLINDLCKNEYSLLRNHFYPTFKLEQKIRIKSRNKRIYGDPLTPYQRVIESDYVDDDIKKELKKIHKSLDPILLKRKMEQKLKNIFALHKTLKKKRESFLSA
jgi:5S rRNA maturation endonuclease (ribonuclease M5)